MCGTGTETVLIYIFHNWNPRFFMKVKNSPTLVWRQRADIG
jgi:hypothetical protein